MNQSFPVRGVRKLSQACVVCCAVTCICVASELRTIANDDVATVLANVRQALKLPEAASEQAFVLEGDAAYSGVEGKFRVLYDDRGRFLQQVNGKLPNTTCFDGKDCWKIGWNQTPQQVELRERQEAILGAAFSTLCMFLPEAAFDFVVDENDAAEKFAAMRVTTQGGEVAGKILIDRATWLPKSMQLLIPRGSTTELSDYLQAAGRSIPAKVVVNQATGQTNTFTMTHSAAIDSLDLDELAYPSGMPANFAFDHSAPAALEIKQAPTGHLLVHVQVDDAEPAWFILDTGAGSLGVNTSYAKERNLKGFGRVNVQGIGGSAISQFRLAKSLKVGPLTLQDPILVEIDLDFLEQYMGVPIAGILGFELFSRCVAEVDFVAPKVELFDATEYELAQGTSWNELFYIDRLPAIEAEFEESGKGIFKLDTGAAGSTLMFHSPAVKHFKLLEGRETSTSQTGGVGGAVSVEMGPLSSFRFGGHEVKDQQVGFAIGEGDSAFSDEASAGNIGGVWLRPFTLVLDYPQKRIAFVKKPE